MSVVPDIDGNAAKSKNGSDLRELMLAFKVATAAGQIVSSGREEREQK